MIVHGLHFGISLCGKPGVPAEWPLDHRWVPKDAWTDITCEECLASRKIGEGDTLYKRFLGGGFYVKREGESYWLGHQTKDGVSRIRVRKETYDALSEELSERKAAGS